MIEKINAIIALITVIIGVLGTVYKIGFKKNDERLDEYYKSVLKPFIVEYKKNKKINTVKFLKDVVMHDEDYVPKYVFSLMHSESKEELKKVLIYDYFEFYRNDDNIMKKIIRTVGRVSAFSLFFFSFFLLLFCIIYILSIFYMLPVDIYDMLNNLEVASITFIKIKVYTFKIISGLVLFLLSILCVKLASDTNEDIYTVKKKKIKKLIDKRVKTYDKKIETVVL